MFLDNISRHKALEIRGIDSWGRLQIWINEKRTNKKQKSRLICANIRRINNKNAF